MEISALYVEERIQRLYKRYNKTQTLIQMLPITHVTDFPPAVERTKKYVLLPSEHEPNRETLTNNGVLRMLRDWSVPQVVLRTRVLLGVYQELVFERHWHRMSHVPSANLLQGVSHGGGSVEDGCMGDAVFGSF